MENNNYVSVGNIIEQERLRRQAQIAKGVSSDVYDHIEKAYSNDLSQSFEKSENLERFERDIQGLNKAETDLLLHKIQRQMNVDSDSTLLKAMKSIAIQHSNELEKATYVDNAKNRKLGRVGQEYGGKKSDSTQSMVNSNGMLNLKNPDAKRFAELDKKFDDKSTRKQMSDKEVSELRLLQKKFHDAQNEWHDKQHSGSKNLIGYGGKTELQKRVATKKELEKYKMSEKDGSALMGKLMEAWELDSNHSFGERKKWENKLVETLNKMGKSAKWFNENAEVIANADTGEYDDELEKLYDVNGIDDLFRLVREIGDDTENEPVMDSSSNIGNRIISALKADQGGLNNSSAGKKAQMKIIAAAENFMKKNPKVKLSNEDLENIVGGDIDEVEEKYGELKGWNKLNDAIESYFDAD